MQKLRLVKEQLDKSHPIELLATFGESSLIEPVFVPLLESPALVANPDLVLKPGDNVQVWRGAFHHAGIYMGNSRVINVSDPIGGKVKTRSEVHETSWSQFCAGDNEFRVGLVQLRTLSPQQVADKAVSRLGQLKGEYNLVSRNCQHFAYYCLLSDEMERRVKGKIGKQIVELYAGAAKELIWEPVDHIISLFKS